MNATTSPLARIAAVAIVLILAAAVGLMAGNALNARDAGPAGGPGPFPNVWGNHADIATTSGAPSYADPHRAHIQEGAAAAAEAPGYADPYRQLIRQGAASDADPITSESWGNVAETSGRDSLTAPSLR